MKKFSAQITRQATHGANMLKELEARTAEQVVLIPFLGRRFQHWSDQVMLDKETVVELVRAGDACAQETEGGEAEMSMPDEARLWPEEAADRLGEGRGRKNEVFRAEGMVRDEEAEEVAEMREDGDVGRREVQGRICTRDGDRELHQRLAGDCRRANPPDSLGSGNSSKG